MTKQVTIKIHVKKCKCAYIGTGKREDCKIQTYIHTELWDLDNKKRIEAKGLKRFAKD
jgi:hypothetical protein